MESLDNKVAFLARHGEYIPSKISGNSGLSLIGILDARDIGENLKSEIEIYSPKLVTIYHSPKQRTQETAKYIAESLNEQYRTIIKESPELNLLENGEENERFSNFVLTTNYDVGIFITHNPNIKKLIKSGLEMGKYSKL